MSLVEFADDNLAFDPDKNTSIKQTDRTHLQVNCGEDCPHKETVEYMYDTRHFCKKHDVWSYHTEIVVDGKELTVTRPFADVMLVLTAHQLDNADKSE